MINYRVNAGFIPSTHWTQDLNVGGGRIIGEGCHFIDLCTYLTGSLPIRVQASALPDGGVYQQDNAAYHPLVWGWNHREHHIPGERG